MIEIFEKIVVPIITAIIGFFGGCEFTKIKYKKIQKNISINGNNNEIVNGDKR